MARPRKWNLWIAFLVGAVIGASIGLARGIIVYGRYDVGFLFNHVLGGFFIGGVLLLAFVFLRNWFQKHPA